ncbi:MAG: hypothetical protein CMM61_03785 [Rhodospirillaceae bacterium]|nr:hypothetical protein [Rhodospirillaceae bacterium]
MSRAAITKHRMFYDPSYPAEIEQSPRQVEMVQKYNRDILDGTLSMEEVPCLCGSTEFDLVATYDRNRAYQPIVLCRNCGLMQCQPRHTAETNHWFYSSDYYRDTYKPGGFKVPTKEEFLAQAESRSALRERALRGLDPARIKTVAEIGCANGINLYGFHQMGKEVFGCDLSPAMVEMGQSMGMNLQVGSLETLGDRKFDLIILSHVLEHMRDPVGEIRRILRHLEDEGALYIEVPDARAFFLTALQAAHLYYFTPRTLIHYLAPLGIAPVSESDADQIHFGIVFKRTETPPTSGLAGEYEMLRKLITTVDRRDRLRDVLVRCHLLPLARFIRRMFNR